MAVLFWVVLSILQLSDASSSLYCPELYGTDGLWPNVLKETNETSPNTTDIAILTNREDFISRITDRITKRTKRFFRFRIPAADLGMLTVIWVVKDFKPMLHYPHNFETLSFASMNIVTESIDEDDLRWACPNRNKTCILPKRQLAEVVTEITSRANVSYEYLCIQADYGISDIVSDYANDKSLEMLNARNFALPDVLYYWRFLKMLFIVRRPPFGFHSVEEDFPNYYCYGGPKNECRIKELHIRYWLVVYLALGLWLYSPLLIYYLPSQKPSSTIPLPPTTSTSGMIPAYKSPVHFSKFLQNLFCYRVSPNSRCAGVAVRIRRIIFMLGLAVFSFRIFLYFDYSLLLFLCLALFVSYPKYLSVHIKPQVPKCFPLFPNSPYPFGIICWNSYKSQKKEYQLLAYVMQERIFLIFDKQFWQYLFDCSFESMYSSNSNVWKLIFYFMKGVLFFLASIVVLVTYFTVPLPFFLKEMSVAIFRGECHYQQRPSLISWSLRLIHGVIMLFVLVYIVITLLAICCLMADMTMFSYMGCSLNPKLGLKYVSLIVSSGTAIYSMVHTLHEEYNSLLVTLIELLKKDETFSAIQSKLQSIVPAAKVEMLKDGQGIYLHKIGEPPNTVYKRVLTKDCTTSYFSKDIYFFTINHQLPIRRQVTFLLLKATLAISFILLAMMMKNVYHLESKVEDIFSLASKIAVSFLPTFFQFIAYKYKFAQDKQDTIRKRECIESLTLCVSKIEP